MAAQHMAAQSPTPTDNGIAQRLADFPTLTDALDYAAGGAGGVNFYSARGALEDVLSWAALREQALAVAGRLLGRGLAPGDRVAIVAETESDFHRALMGCLYARLVPCPAPLPSAFGSRAGYVEQIRRIADVASIAAAISPAMFGNWVADALEGRRLAFVGTLADLDNAPERPPGAGERPADEIAYLQFSSGTTSFPKGIAVTHAAMMANIRAMAVHAFQMREGDRGVSWLPYYHDMGLVGCVMLPIATQMSADFIKTRDFILRPGNWLDLISRYRGTMTYAPSFGYDLAARRSRPRDDLDLASLRIAGIGGDIIKMANIRSFAETFAEAGFRPESFLPSYGMAEASLGLAFAPLGSGARTEPVDVDRLRDEHIAAAPGGTARSREFAICGRPLPDHEIEIRDAAGTALPESRVGQIFVRGPSVMQGYFGNPEETALVLSPDGWLDTGDLGYMRGGEIVVTGRVKDLIIINGRNIWPQDIEWSVESQVDGAKEGSVAAFQLADEGADETDAGRVAVVVECRRRQPQEREALRAAAHAVVRGVCGIEARVALCAPGALPRTSSGKLSRTRAREMFLAGAFDA
ncbi:MAG TPA: fatty acyl-AMP ligase [Thermohalobaculum sp.]|nr:fatty acyl-AMP ligase [Thermohalobaculum sp.]